MAAIGVIVKEHALPAVVHGMLYVVHGVRDRGDAPDFTLLGAMIGYIDMFPERLHHPKENDYLFRLLRARCPAASPLIDRLINNHRVGAETIRALGQALIRYEHRGDAEFSEFPTAVEMCADFERQRMRIEETELIPLAVRHLAAADWEEVDAAFLGTSDPLLGAQVGSRYDALFSCIVNLAPLPIGSGPERRPT